MEIVAIENVIAKNQRTMAVAEECFTDKKGLRQTVGAGLHGVLQVDAPLAAITKQLFEARRVLLGGDDKYVAYAGQHQRAERVVNHGLVVHRNQLFADRKRSGVKASAGASRQDDASALH